MAGPLARHMRDCSRLRIRQQPDAEHGRLWRLRIEIESAEADGLAVDQAEEDAALVPEARISGLKTFFTKLHPGALVFLDEQVTEWLKAHPDVQIKRTNVSVGEVMSKKTEPNIIINVWY